MMPQARPRDSLVSLTWGSAASIATSSDISELVVTTNSATPRQSTASAAGSDDTFGVRRRAWEAEQVTVQDTYSRINGIDGTINTLGMRVGGLETRMGGLETRMGGLETQMGGLETRMGGLETQMGGLETRMGGLETRMGGLETRVGGLESQVGDLKDSVEAGIQQLLDMTSQTLQTHVNVVSTKIADLERSQGGLLDRILKKLGLGDS